MSLPRPRTKAEVKAIHAAAEAVAAAVKALQVVNHLGVANPPNCVVAATLVRSAAAHSEQWRAIEEG